MIAGSRSGAVPSLSAGATRVAKTGVGAHNYLQYEDSHWGARLPGELLHVSKFYAWPEPITSYLLYHSESDSQDGGWHSQQ